MKCFLWQGLYSLKPDTSQCSVSVFQNNL
ncbi:rCG63464, partial [Rattus norvegicus]